MNDPENDKKTPKELPTLSTDYRYGFHDRDVSVVKFQKGLTRKTVEEISAMKNEPGWMTDFRLRALDVFFQKEMPAWGGDLTGLNFDEITYYVKPAERQGKTWEEVPEEIKDTFEKLGIPEAERKFLAGVSAQYESEVVYHSMQKELAERGVIFTDTDSALRDHPELFKKYFGTVIPPQDNKFAALNSAVWSGGSFVYVPKGVRCDVPLQAYFRINSENMGQFERTLIIAEDDSFVHYVEGCTAPIYSTDSLHAAVVEILVKDRARCRYTTIQNWAPNIYNLVTKRAVAHADAAMEWVDGNIGSKLTMKYPAVYMLGPRAKGTILSIAVAGQGQHQDAGAKVVHLAPDCTSTVVSKSISKQGGKTTYRGLCEFGPKAAGSKANIKCDTLIFDKTSTSDTIPVNHVRTDGVTLEHEASVSKVSEEQMFYLQSRGLTEEEATTMIVMGFIEPFTKELPMEYAVEMNRLIKFEMKGSIG
ncbi:Fe-S cluster assembly protein SufB [Tumebacillus flagellatus]|uniref:Fe-S cluster assembly protein SufB n=1 Tax=Tumebacillus flagellatus TaxID=1157490 RepID=A0A074LP46_9BACL|nr:Fe-S cluster assembly protein SufB [Tumebacillus flagellatus]KEO82879.1 Fe-S cluster assembly protein SufB [Tumebacillus flagellatus]